MELVTIVQIVFVAAAVVTVLALIGAVLDRLRRRVLIGIALVAAFCLTLGVPRQAQAALRASGALEAESGRA